MNLKQKLILLLSDPEISEREFSDITTWLAEGGIIECLQDAESIRNKLRSYRNINSDNNRGVTSDSFNSSVRSSSDDLVSEIESLLRREARMTARAALEELKEATGFKGKLPERISFAAGVRRIRDEVGASKVLNVAHQIRNGSVHQIENLAWPLNRDR